MNWRLPAIMMFVFLLAGCMSIPNDSSYGSDSTVPPSTDNEYRTEEPVITDQLPSASTPAPSPQPQTQNPALPSDHVSQPSTEPPAPEPAVIYNGPVEHIFFHPLVAYPELAFDGDSLSQGYDDWFVTVPEFKHIIDELYKNNYMLIDIRSLYEEKPGNGQTTYQPKVLKLPKGKKPLVLSIDDLNYYEYMIQNGNVHKLALNSAGDVVTESVDPKGNRIVSDDNEIVPILDRFVREHPDFSDRGAKGVIALTGYQGVLGYRTNDLQPAKAEQERKDAAPVIERLKETGWSFASHGWGHLDAVKVSYNRLVQDTERWKREVEPLIGATPVYIYPYGSQVETGGDKFNALVREGFHVFCSIGPAPYLKWQSGEMLMDRRHIDGMALQTQRSRLLPLFDAGDVLDPIRIKLLKKLKK